MRYKSPVNTCESDGESCVVSGVTASEAKKTKRNKFVFSFSYRDSPTYFRLMSKITDFPQRPLFLSYETRQSSCVNARGNHPRRTAVLALSWPEGGGGMNSSKTVGARCPSPRQRGGVNQFQLVEGWSTLVIAGGGGQGQEGYRGREYLCPGLGYIHLPAPRGRTNKVKTLPSLALRTRHPRSQTLHLIFI